MESQLTSLFSAHFLKVAITFDSRKVLYTERQRVLGCGDESLMLRDDHKTLSCRVIKGI